MNSARSTNRTFGLALAAAGGLAILAFIGPDLLRGNMTLDIQSFKTIMAAAGALGLTGGLLAAFVLQTPVPGWAINGFVSVLAVGAILIVIEAGLRIWDPFPVRASLDSYAVAEPDLGWRLRPGAEVTAAIPQSRVTVRINSQGLRDIEHDLAPEAGAFRIVVLGDSFMEGFFVELEEIFARQLEGLFHANGYTHVEVINLGVGRYNSLQEYLIFEKYGVTYEPDLVLLGLFVENDIPENLGSPSDLPLDAKWGTRPPTLDAATPDEWHVLTPSYRQNAVAIDTAVKGLEEDHTHRSWRDIRQWQSYGLYERLLANRSGLFRVRLLDPRGWLTTYLCDPPPSIENGWIATDLILGRLAESVEESGAQLVVFSVPSVVETDPDVRALALRDVEDPEIFCFDPPRTTERLAAILADHEIPFIDLLPEFRRVTNEEDGDLFFTVDDWHWSPDGHQLAAEIVYQALLDRGMIPEPAPASGD